MRSKFYVDIQKKKEIRYYKTKHFYFTSDWRHCVADLDWPNTNGRCALCVCVCICVRCARYSGALVLSKRTLIGTPTQYSFFFLYFSSSWHADKCDFLKHSITI